MNQNVIKLTFNLNSIVNSLRYGIENAFEKAFIDIYDRELPVLQSMLDKEIDEALEKTPEFNIPEFYTSLKSLVTEPNLINPFPNEELELVEVFIDMESFAGNIEDYANGVRMARIAGGFGIHGDPKRASELWRDFIYAPAREGGTGNSELYYQTLELRRQHFQGLAPYWYIIEHGTRRLTSDRGGDAYPVTVPTHFVARAEATMSDYFNQNLGPEMDSLLTRFRDELGEVYDFVSEINRVVTDSKYNPKDYVEPRIIREFAIAQRRYKLYISRTGRLGLSLRPEI